MHNKLRRPIFRIIAGISAFLVIFLLIVAVKAIFFRPKASLPDTSDWQTGMVFFSVGDSWESAAVRTITGVLNLAVTDSTPSHCGIVLMDEKGPLLVHASTVAGHLVAETPSEYVEKNGSFCIYVKPQPFKLDTFKLKSDIDSLLKHPVQFDFKFDHSDARTLYCTEFVVLLHELNGCRSLSSLRDKHYIYPQDILNILNSELPIGKDTN